MQVGEALPSERDLASAMAVSRETIRAAIKLLAQQGIISIQQGARSRVLTAETGTLALMAPGRLSVSSYALDEVHSTRQVVEGEVIRLAAERIEASTLAMLERLIEAQKSMLGDALGFLISDRAFHASIYRACGNALLSDLAMDLYGYLADRRRVLIAEPGQIAASIGDHQAIYAALLRRDPEAAVAAFAAHEHRIYTTTQRLVGPAQNLDLTGGLSPVAAPLAKGRGDSHEIAAKKTALAGKKQKTTAKGERR